MANTSLPSKELLCQILSYDELTGKLFWKQRESCFFKSSSRLSAAAKANAWNGRNAGREAFTASDGKGYLQGQVLKYHTTAHRVIWALVHGVWPDCIDHIDGDGCNNRLENLRAVTLTDNARNRARSSGQQMGVRFHKGIWEAYIGVASRTHYIGSFNSEREAIEARIAAEGRHGYHANHGRALKTRDRNGLANNFATCERL